MKTFAKYKNVP